MTIRHVILDRDGVLNREPADGWIADPAAWVWEERAPAALARLADAGVAVSVVTNQSVVGRALAEVARVESVHRHMIEDARRLGGRIDHVLVCPHAADAACACRKPRPGLVQEAIRLTGVRPDETLLIGDDLRDLDAGRSAGVRVALVRTGRGAAVEHLACPRPPVFDDLLHAVETLVAAAPPARGAVTASDRIHLAFAGHRAALDASEASLRGALEAVVEAAAACVRGGGKILACGNAGSAAAAEHLVAELLGRAGRHRRPVAAVALSASGAVASALSNDGGHEGALARQVEALARPGDLVLAFSASGGSENVLRAARAARDLGCTTVAVTGGGGALARLCDHALAVTSASAARVEEVHALCLHALAEALEAELFGDAPEVAR